MINIKPYKSCIYDNPVTLSKEYWVNGLLVSSIPLETLHNKYTFVFGIPTDRTFINGRIIGDKEAISKEFLND